MAMDLNIPVDLHAIIGVVSATLGSASTAAFLTWRKIMRDKNSAKLEATKTNAEIDVVEHLQSQRDYAMNELKEATKAKLVADYESQNAKTKIAALEVELGNLRSRVQLLSQLVTRLTTALDLTRNQLNSIIKRTMNPDEPRI